MVGPLTVPTCFQAGRGRLNGSLHGPDVIYVNHKRRCGDLVCAQHSPRTSPGSGARIYKQCHIHGSVTCSIHSASAGRPPHKWNIIPCCVCCVFPSAVCFLSCSALADGEVVSCSPQAGAGAGDAFAAISREARWPQRGEELGLLWGMGHLAVAAPDGVFYQSHLSYVKMFLIQPPKSSFLAHGLREKCLLSQNNHSNELNNKSGVSPFCCFVGFFFLFIFSFCH